MLANFTSEIGISFVYFYMLLLVRDLIKLHKTVPHRAVERLLLGVDPQVVEQIVPLPEQLTTTIKVTTEYRWLLAFLRNTIFYQSKILSIRYLIVVYKRWNIYGMSFEQRNLNFMGKLVLLNDSFLYWFQSVKGLVIGEWKWLLFRCLFGAIWYCVTVVFYKAIIYNWILIKLFVLESIDKFFVNIFWLEINLWVILEIPLEDDGGKQLELIEGLRFLVNRYISLYRLVNLRVFRLEP